MNYFQVNEALRDEYTNIWEIQGKQYINTFSKGS